MTLAADSLTHVIAPSRFLTSLAYWRPAKIRHRDYQEASVMFRASTTLAQALWVQVYPRRSQHLPQGLRSKFFAAAAARSGGRKSLSGL